MKKILLYVGAALGLAAVVFLVTTNNPDDTALESEFSNQVEFYESTDGEFSIQYINESTDQVRLTHDGKEYDLEKSGSDTGTRYESADGQVVFFETEGRGNIMIKDELVVAEAITTRRRVEVLKSNKQGDPDANKYDFSDGTTNGVDNDCDDPNGDGRTDDSTCAPGDPIPGIDITTDNEADLNIGHNTETQGSSDTSVSSSDRATDYNSSRSNKSY